MRKRFFHLPLYITISALLLVSLNFCNKGITETDIVGKESEKQMNSEPLHCQVLIDPCSDPACKPYYLCDEDPHQIYHISYAGVTIDYDPRDHMLNFRSMGDLNIVLNQLDAEYESHNQQYENQYPTLTPEELDAMDEVTGFDEFATYRAFENLFPGYHSYSQRGIIENLEETWLAGNMTGQDPSGYDRTCDNSENAIAGDGYNFMIAGEVFTISNEGAVLRATGCSTNKKADKLLTSPDQSRRFKLEVAIHSIGLRSSVKGKVNSYIKKGSRWKRSRVNLRVFCSGTIFDNPCGNTTSINISKPGSGYRRCKELKVVQRDWLTVYKSKPNGISAAFEAQNITTGSLILNK